MASFMLLTLVSSSDLLFLQTSDKMIIGNEPWASCVTHAVLR